MAKAGCRSSASHDNFRRELLRQAMADRSRLKAKRALNQAIVVQYAYYYYYYFLFFYFFYFGNNFIDNAQQ